jgi:hypothetical protein
VDHKYSDNGLPDDMLLEDDRTLCKLQVGRKDIKACMVDRYDLKLMVSVTERDHRKITLTLIEDENESKEEVGSAK